MPRKEGHPYRPLMPGVTTFISIPAGIKRVPVYGWFMLVTVLDTLLWSAVFIGVGWALSSQWTLVERYSAIVHYAVVVALCVPPAITSEDFALAERGAPFTRPCVAPRGTE